VQVTDASRNAVNEGERLAKKQSSEWQGRGLRAEEETSKANWKNETKNTLNKVLLRYNINIAINCPIQSPYHTALHAKTRQSSFLLIDTMTGFRRPACIHYSPGVGNLWHVCPLGTPGNFQWHAEAPSFTHRLIIFTQKIH